MSQENNNDLQAFDDSSRYTRNHYPTSLNQLTNSISSAVEQLEAENRELKLQVSKLREENRNLRSNESPIDKQELRERLQAIKSMCENCESILGLKVHPSMKPPIGYHPQGLTQNHLQMHPQIGENMVPMFNFGAQSMLTTKPPTPERMVEETNGPPSPSNSHENSTSGNINSDYPIYSDVGDTEEQTNNYNNDKPNLQMSSPNGINNNIRRTPFNYNNNGSSSSSNSNNNNTFKKKSAFTVWVAWRGRPSTDSQLRQIFGGLDIKDVRPSPNKSFAHIDFSTADSMNKALARNGEDILNYGHLRVEKGNPHPRPTMGKNTSLPSSSSSPLSSSSLQSPNSPQSHSSPKQPSFSSPPPIPPHTPTSFSDNRPRQQNQQNRKSDYGRGGYPNTFNNRQNGYADELDENQKGAIKNWQDMAQGTTSISNNQEHKGNNSDM